MSNVFGQQHTDDNLSPFNAQDFHIRQRLAKVRTAVPVKVVAVHGGGVGAPPTVDVLPTVNMTDGQGNSSQHLTVYGIPVARLQGGANAVICDPVAGDYGLIVCSDRDISAVKANKGAQSNPGSFRRHNLADAIYIGAILNAGAPTQYVEFTSAGITLKDKSGNSIVTSSAGVNINGLVIDLTGNLVTPGGVTAGNGGGDSVTLQHHEHSANNTPPTPGT